MDALWADLSTDDAGLESPAWHQEALQETESKLQSGQETVLDWTEAKQLLWKRFA
jgi:hypothetical protein